MFRSKLFRFLLILLLLLLLAVGLYYLGLWLHWPLWFVASHHISLLSSAGPASCPR